MKSKLKIVKTKKHSDDEDTEGVDGNALAKLVETSSDDDLLKAGGIYYIFGPIEEGTLTSLHQNILLKHLAGPKIWKSDLVFVINSGGGLVDETNALLDLLSNVRMDVRTVGMGMCGSAAACLLASGTKGKRSAGISTTIMIHCYSWGAVGKHHELVAARDAQNNFYEQEVDFWIKHSKYKSRKDVEKYLLRKEDTWLTAKEALHHGIIDHIGDVLR
jgi:ATP-dependent Clp endopeptidase proteolytic subunit ClpP